jgi:hypothetical protein
MSYKHNNLMAMRKQYWQDQSAQVLTEKAALQHLLQQHALFAHPSLEDTQYVFFQLPSQIIIQGYALGFMHEKVQALVVEFLMAQKNQLMQKLPFKVAFRC